MLLNSLSPSADVLVIFPAALSSSVRFGKLLLSRGLHRPKSESFRWPVRSNNKLSGLISLKRCNKELAASCSYYTVNGVNLLPMNIVMLVNGFNC